MQRCHQMMFKGEFSCCQVQQNWAGRGKGAFTGYLPHVSFLLPSHGVFPEEVLTGLLAFIISK